VIGVVATAADLQVAEEFFELFKTPWEPAQTSRRYTAILSTGGHLPDGIVADVVLAYGSSEQAIDDEAGIKVERIEGESELAWKDLTIPIHSCVARFDGRLGPGLVTCAGQSADYLHASGGRVVRRIGYDLFREVNSLLTVGQPAADASIPTLELHIALLRQMLLKSGIAFVEIPPRPHGYDFICCLTHDVDFFGIRRHKFDRTLAGFVARASIGTLVDIFRGRRTLTQGARNWAALLSLPFVFLRLVPDLWHPFEDYDRAESGRRSTFFLVPFKGRPGISPDGEVVAHRAVAYQISEIGDEVRALRPRGHETAVHGIDAWRDAAAGRAELAELTSVTGQREAGVRMHWLYLAADSPTRLEAAGFRYDSSWGYNEAVGFRAGTSQVFRLPGTQSLMELPMAIMDSAMFFPGRMDLARDDAFRLCEDILRHTTQFGGTLVVNWHDRSLVPERLWDEFYRDLLRELETNGRALFTTAGEAVDWFRWRRSIHFTELTGCQTGYEVWSASRYEVAPAVVQVHRPSTTSRGSVEELRFEGREPLRLEL
jgi:hypothetical protein